MLSKYMHFIFIPFSLVRYYNNKMKLCLTKTVIKTYNNKYSDFNIIFQEARIFKAEVTMYYWEMSKLTTKREYFKCVEYNNNNMSRPISLTKGDSCNSGISLPKAVMARIDSVKHPDIPRSKWVLRVLEAALMRKEKELTNQSWIVIVDWVWTPPSNPHSIWW
jgi:hypothetical protein